MNPIRYTLSLGAASANAIALTQTPTGNLTLNGALVSGGVATLDVGRRVLITNNGDNSGVTFAIYGTNQTGNVIQETLAGANATTVQSLLDYKTVTRISISSPSTGSLTVGTSSVGSTPWILTNYQMVPVSIGLFCVVAGTVNYTVEYCGDDIQNSIPTPLPHPYLTSKTTTEYSDISYPVVAYRLTVNSGPGSVQFTGIQSGIRN